MFWFLVIFSLIAIGQTVQNGCEHCPPIYSCDDPFFTGTCQEPAKLEGNPTTEITKTEDGCLYSVTCPPASLPFYKEPNGLWRSDFGTTRLSAVCLAGQWFKLDGKTATTQILCA